MVLINGFKWILYVGSYIIRLGYLLNLKKCTCCPYVVAICCRLDSWWSPIIHRLFCLHVLTVFAIWVNNQKPDKVWDEITYPFSNFNCCSVEVWEWISNFTSHFIMVVITSPCWDQRQSMSVKGTQRVPHRHLNNHTPVQMKHPEGYGHSKTGHSKTEQHCRWLPGAPFIDRGALNRHPGPRPNIKTVFARYWDYV